ncbi:MAG: sensor histidine kinase, partial [Anaerolineales bacterium]|nr:sensor histidine kinase [Anaerolineales bacterium]
NDKEAIIRSAMNVGCDLLDASGCSFIPFDEWGQSFRCFTSGQIPQTSTQVWEARLSEPVSRQTCKICEVRQAGRECILLRETVGAEKVFCVGLRSNGREFGALNFYFDKAAPEIEEDIHRFLSEMVRLVDLALIANQTRAVERQILKDIQLIDLDAIEFPDMRVAQIKYQAIIGERVRLAREIHDGLAQTLAFLKMEASRVKNILGKGEYETAAGILDACHRILSDAYLDARQAIDNLRSAPEVCFAEWLKKAAIDFEQTVGIPVFVSDLEISSELPANVQAQISRIVQEALTNIRKHADARHVILKAVMEAEKLVIEVKDDGRGFSPEEAFAANRYGLRGMRERAELIGAEFIVFSRPGKGAAVGLKIPVRKDEIK